MSYVPNTDPTFPTSAQAPDYSNTPEAPPKKRRRWPWVVTGIAVAFLLGSAVGASGKDTKTNTVTNTKTVTSIVESNVTPESCQIALAQADKLFGVTTNFATHSAAAMSGASHGFTAIGNADSAGVDAATTEITDAAAGIRSDTAQVEEIAPVYRDARDSCESS